MANKQVKKQQQNQRREKLLRDALNQTLRLHIVSVIIIVLAFLMLLVSFTSIYNSTDGSTEVSVSGWSFFFCGLTGDFESSQEIYGSIGVFYYWAPQITRIVASLTLIAAAAMLLNLVCEVVTLVAKMHFVTLLSMFFGLVAVALFIAVYAVQFSFAEPVIYDSPSYCNGNTACSIQSSAFLPAVILIASEAVEVIICVKLRCARKNYGE